VLDVEDEPVHHAPLRCADVCSLGYPVVEPGPLDRLERLTIDERCAEPARRGGVEELEKQPVVGRKTNAELALDGRDRLRVQPTGPASAATPGCAADSRALEIDELRRTCAGPRSLRPRPEPLEEERAVGGRDRRG